MELQEVEAVAEGGVEVELIRSFKRTHWANGSVVPPWPVQRWWTLCAMALR
jgi:hypothetical protein